MIESLHQEINDTRQIQEVAASVSSLLRSYDTVAYVLGLKQGRTIKSWVEEGTIPSNPTMESRLRLTEKLALAVKDEQRPWVSGAWLISCNPRLDEIQPMTVIQSIGTDEYSESLLSRTESAAYSFAVLED